MTAQSTSNACLPFAVHKRLAGSPLLASELVGHPEHRAVDHGTMVAGQVNDAGLDDEPAELGSPHLDE